MDAVYKIKRRFIKGTKTGSKREARTTNKVENWYSQAGVYNQQAIFREELRRRSTSAIIALKRDK